MIVIIAVLLLVIVGLVFKIRVLVKKESQPTKNLPIEKEPIEEQQEIKTILRGMAEGVLVITENEKILLANQPAIAMIKAGEAVEGKVFWEVIRHVQLKELIKKALQNQSTEKKQITVFLPEEKILDAQVSSFEFKGKGKNGIVCVLHDITALKKLERLRTDFVANVSHELKTPLTSIKGFVETLQQGALEDTENARKFLGIIEEQTIKLEKLISDVLDLSRLEENTKLQDLKAVSLKAVLEAVEKTFWEQAQRKDIAIQIDVPEDFPALQGNEEQLERLFSNLLSNALKYTPNGGEIKVSSKEVNKVAVISVEDNGIGIPEEHFNRLFERFYRIDNARSRDAGGTGLGLSIVKHIIQIHGGDIHLESHLGKGSTFTVKIPIALAEKA